MEDLIVRASKVCFSFKTRSTWARRKAVKSKELLSNVTFDVPAGKVLALLGPSGIGKSTLLRIIAGLIEANTGEIEVCGIRPTEARKQGMIGYVPQKRHLLPWKTVRGNIFYPPFRDADTLLLKDIATRLRIGDILSKRPHEISGGQESRAALARAFIRNPKLLLMDEPFGSVDLLLREELWGDLRNAVNAYNSASIITTHDICEAQAIGDFITVLGSPGGGQGATLEKPFLNNRTSDKSEREAQRSAIEDAIRRSYTESDKEMLG